MSETSRLKLTLAGISGLVSIIVAVVGVLGTIAVAGNKITDTQAKAEALQTQVNQIGVPAGTIVAFNGNLKAIPPGWVICNSENHKNDPAIPDLSGRFLKGVEDSETVGLVGGRKTHSHNDVWHTGFDGQLRPHGDGIAGMAPGSQNSIGHTDEASNMPPYYTVIYIIKQ